MAKLRQVSNDAVTEMEVARRVAQMGVTIERFVEGFMFLAGSSPTAQAAWKHNTGVEVGVFILSPRVRDCLGSIRRRTGRLQGGLRHVELDGLVVIGVEIVPSVQGHLVGQMIVHSDADRT